VLPGQGCVRTQDVRSNVLAHAFDRGDVRLTANASSAACVRSPALCSTSGLRVRSTVDCAFARFAFDRSLYIRPQITALKSHGASKLAMAARATQTSRADEEYVRTWLLRSTVVRSNERSFERRTCIRTQL
jgi:hypothetical protein